MVFQDSHFGFQWYQWASLEVGVRVYRGRHSTRPFYKRESSVLPRWGKVKILWPSTNQGLSGREEASGGDAFPPRVGACDPAVLDVRRRKGHPRYPGVGRAVTSVRELLQREHTAEYKPGTVSKRDKFRPNLLQNNSPVKHIQSVLIHPWSHVTTTVMFFTPAETPREGSVWNACGAY